MAEKKPKKTVSKSSKSKSVKAKIGQTKTAVGQKDKAEIRSCKEVFKGFFARKGEPNENILTIFKTPKIYGALLGEIIGTMFLSMLLLTLGVQPLYIVFGAIGITMAIVGLSGAHLNPLITAGMMATRRVSAIRGILYILAQVLGAWFGLLIINAFRLGSGTDAELPQMAKLTGNGFWAAALVELVGAVIIGFFFARAWKYRKNVINFGMILTSGVTLAIIFGVVVSQSYFQTTNSFVFDPAIALMYQILPSSADSFGQLMGDLSLALLAYAVFPMIGGIVGFFLSDTTARLACEEDSCEDCCCKA